MKPFPLLLCILLTGLVAPAFGKLDGTYMNEAGMTLKTPHAAWDEKGELPHKKILFIMQQTASREIIELVQRFHKTGKGKAILLNASLSVLENNSLPESSLNTFLDRVVKSAGVRPPAVIPDFSNTLMVRPRQAGEFELLGALGQEKDLGKSFTAALPKEKYIYECRKGLVGKSDRLVFKFSQAPFRCFALFDLEQQPPVVTAPEQVAKGDRAMLKISGPANPRERAYRITVTAPDGREILHRNKTICGKTEYPLDFAFNDLPGIYRISIEDAATGLNAQHEIEVK